MPVTLDNARFDVELVDTSAPDAVQFIAQRIEELGADPLNIVYSKAAEAITLPTMTLRQITFEQFVSFINRIGGAPQNNGQDPFAGEGGGDMYSPPHSGPRFGITDNDGIWYFWAEESPQSRIDPTSNPPGSVGSDGGGGRDMTTRIFSLDGDADATLGLIEEALGATRRFVEHPDPMLKFHEPSSPLIVSGGTADLQLIEQVISVLEIRKEKQRQREDQSVSSKS